MSKMNKMNGTTSETTVSQVFDDIIVSLMFNYLKTVFPVKRTKYKGRFKRAVEIDGRMFLLPKDNLVLFGNLFTELKVTYSSTDGEILHVLTEFYSIDTNPLSSLTKRVSKRPK